MLRIYMSDRKSRCGCRVSEPLLERRKWVSQRGPCVVLILLIHCAVFLCASVSAAEIVSKPLGSLSNRLDNRFEQPSGKEVGLEFENHLEKQNIRKYLYNGSGGCVGDYDGDGLPDLYLVSQDGENRLFRQTAPWRFEDVTDSAGDLSGGESWDCGATFADIDGDGDLDLHVCGFGGPDRVWMNQGDGTFAEEAAKRGLDHAGPTVMAAYSDYDRDGDLDCFLLTYRLHQLAETDGEVTLRMIDGKMTVHPDFAGEYLVRDGNPVEAGRRDRLLQNDGNGNFTDVSEAAGLGDDLNHGLSATWFDHDNDGWPDLYVASDFTDPDRLWRNNGDGTFTDKLPDLITYSAWFAMGSDFGDLNRDGWLDLMVADMSAMNHYRQKMEMGEMGRSAWFLTWAEPRQFMRNMVFFNAGGRRFLETGFYSGLESTGWTWAVRAADFDCDGWEDIMITNGMPRDFNNSDFVRELSALDAAGKREERQALLDGFQKPGDDRNKVFRNLGNLRFEDSSETWGYHEMSASYGLITADFDRDGDLDAISCNMNKPLGIYRNEIAVGNRVLIELRGRASNSFGIGTRLRLKSASGWQTRMLTLARGYASGSEPVVHFGLGDDESIERLEIDWPSGARQVIEDLAVGHHHTITEPVGNPESRPSNPPTKEKTLFSIETFPGLDVTHREDEYDDFEKEPLLPWKLSRLGPGVAIGDADADGDEDIWIGGATGQMGTLAVRGEGGEWGATRWQAFSDDSRSEDMGAVFFDPDRDGDLDLYVASGGNQEQVEENPILEDRLYLNVDSDGKKGFVKAAPDPNPANRAFYSASVVAPADFDRDGDVDILVGSRVVPGRIHEVPSHRLLRNEGDRIADVASEIVPGLADVGMIASALWSDIDSDGRLDLLIATAWGPIRVMKQSSNGTFEDFTGHAGLADHSGWWQGIAGGDLDGDGDIDYIATNLGNNTKYHASREHPIKVYLNDFDGNGTFDIVESEYEGDILYPMRGRSCSSQAMPFITEKFESFHAFASAELASIYTKPKLEQSRILRLDHAESSVLLNDGSGHFEIRPLPALAQIAPGFGVCIEDFDGDGNLDAVVAQNFYSPQPETGRMSGGLGVFLKGEGDGTFSEVWPEESGVLIPGDAKSLATIDIDDNGTPDLVCGVNDSALLLLRNQTRRAGVRWSTISLEGLPGNPTAVGARLSIETSLGRMLVREISGGGSYLSQSSPRQYLPMGEKEWISKIRVLWPAGRETRDVYPDYRANITLSETE